MAARFGARRLQSAVDLFTLTIGGPAAIFGGVRMKLAQFRAVVLVALIVGSGSSAFAQSSSDGSIRGYVRDEQGAALPGVALTAESATVAGTFTAVSDGEGYYRFLNLQPATYALTAELQGFAKLVRPDVTTRAGLTLNIDITMKVGNLTETVRVTAEAPLLEAKTAVQAVNISGEFQ